MTDYFQPVSSTRTSDRIAGIIRNTILDGRFRVGDLLPPERTLARQFQVTRNTVREALRRLEQLRLVSIRQGSGVTVRDYRNTAGVELLGQILASTVLQGPLLSDVLEARAVLGKAIYRHALERIDDRAVEALHEAVEAFAREAERPTPDPPTLQRLDFELHSLLVQAGGNQAILFLHNSLRRVYEPIAHLFEVLVDQPRDLAAQYRLVVAALRRGDRAAAADAFDAVLDLALPEPPARPDNPARRTP